MEIAEETRKADDEIEAVSAAEGSVQQDNVSLSSEHASHIPTNMLPGKIGRRGDAKMENDERDIGSNASLNKTQQVVDQGHTDAVLPEDVEDEDTRGDVERKPQEEDDDIEQDDGYVPMTLDVSII